MIVRRARWPTRTGRGGHGDTGPRGRLSFWGSSARRDVALAAERLLALGHASATFREAEWRGRRITYLEAGTGPALMLVHGAGGGAANWFELIGPLSASHRVIAPDLPGFGLSDAIEAEGPLSGAALPALDAVLAAAGVERFDLCGTSFGGLLAARLTQAAPARVRRLALVDSAGLGREAPRRVRIAALPLLGSAMLSRPGPRGIRWELRALVTSTPLPSERENALVAYLLASARVASRSWFVRALRRFVGAAGQREVLSDAELAGIRQPTLVVWGARDRFFPTSHGRRAAAAIPRAVLRVMPDAGHSPNWERPAELASLVSGFFAP